jgi:uncharacterized protein YeaO (DUF488 family)
MNIALIVVVALRLNGEDEESIPRSPFMIKVKRISEKAAASDGSRLLVDRIWPRGLKKNNLALDGWFKEVASSDRLRKWLGHDTKKWKEFGSSTLPSFA